MTRFTFRWILLLCLPVLAAGAEPELLRSLLGCSLLGHGQPMVETQVYTAARVPLIPTFADSASWERYAARLRERVLEEVVFRGEARRWRQSRTRVEWLDIIPAEGYRIRKLRLEVVPGLWAPALLYEPARLAGKVPVVLNVNGHETQGIAVPYIQTRCINLARRGLLALNVEWLGRGQLRTPNLAHQRMNQLDLCGTSGLSVYYLSMTRALDLLLDLEHADSRRVAVTGLSGGGWQTIFLSALDTRVALANPVAGYSSFLTRAQFPDLDLGDSEQTPTDLATLVDYTHLTAMLAPRPALLTYNAYDNCCFRADYAVAPLLQAARPLFRSFGAEDRLRHHVNFGAGHNYDLDNRRAFYRLLGEHFFAGAFDLSETATDAEARSAEQLRVELPSDNKDFHVLARELCRNLPREPGLPAAREAALEWQRQGRSRLGKLVRDRHYRGEAVRVAAEEVAGLKVAFWRLRMGEDWTVPAVELTPGEPKSTILMVADGGRVAVAAEAARRLSQQQRVIALDPFYFGESRIERRSYLFALLLAAVGDRPLGLQASQLAAAARWIEGRGAGPVTLVAQGPRSSLFSLVAAALEPASIAGLELYNSFGSLKEVVENNLAANETPELFCFGLLEAFDIKQLIGLVAPRPVRIMAPADRARAELAGLRDFYRVLGADWDPLR